MSAETQKRRNAHGYNRLTVPLTKYTMLRPPMQAHRFKADLDPRQRQWAAQAAGANRWVYNEARRYCATAYAKGDKYPGFGALCKELTGWRAAQPWLRAGCAQAQQAALAGFDMAMQRMFKKLGGRPARKTRQNCLPSMQFPQVKNCIQQVSATIARVKLPKLGWVRFHVSRAVVGTVRSVTLSRDACFDWHLVVLTDADAALPVAPPGTAIGIDLGVAATATYSDGSAFHLPGTTKSAVRHLLRLKRRLARRQKGSMRRERAKLAVAKLLRKEARRRTDALHKESTRVAQAHRLVVVEALAVKQMTRAAKGKGRAAKAGLNRAILAQGWGTFRAMIRYKTARRAGDLVAVPAAFTSQRCSACGHTDAGNRPSQSVFRCLDCGHAANADVNAAMNILAAGQAESARGRALSPGVSGTSVRARLAARVKREPVETDHAQA